MVPYRDDKSFCMADLPGIIEGRMKGKAWATASSGI